MERSHSPNTSHQVHLANHPRERSHHHNTSHLTKLVSFSRERTTTRTQAI
ncbi:unnamed protein product, partial [Vitis vinifera]